MPENAILSKTMPRFAIAMIPTPERKGAGNDYFGATGLRVAAGKSGRVEIAPVADVPESIAFSQEDIRQQLHRILQSSLFVQSERLSRFLRFIVEHALAGNQKYLKDT
jgi:hypothetical protein